MPKGYPKAKQIVVVQEPPLGEPQSDDRMLSDYPMADRENADRIENRRALVQLGQQYGMLICQMMAWPMDKLRQQIKYAQTQKVMDEWNELQESAV